MAVDPDVAGLEQEVGHPERRWLTLLDHVAKNRVRQFSDIQDEWLELMWCLDAYRHRSVVPRDMGSSKNSNQQLAAIYRGKGNWFSELLAVLLGNRTGERVASTNRVQGFSQAHQIDLAWPKRGEDPLVCAEAKVTGAPAYAKCPERGAMADFTNRRKELKFAATDLKLYRRDRDTAIEHWVPGVKKVLRRLISYGPPVCVAVSYGATSTGRARWWKLTVSLGWFARPMHLSKPIWMERDCSPGKSTMRGRPTSRCLWLIPSA